MYKTVQETMTETIKRWKLVFGESLTQEDLNKKWEDKNFQALVEALHQEACARRRTGA